MTAALSPGSRIPRFKHDESLLEALEQSIKADIALLGAIRTLTAASLTGILVQVEHAQYRVVNAQTKQKLARKVLDEAIAIEAGERA